MPREIKGEIELDISITIDGDDHRIFTLTFPFEAFPGEAPYFNPYMGGDPGSDPEIEWGKFTGVEIDGEKKTPIDDATFEVLTAGINMDHMEARAIAIMEDELGRAAEARDEAAWNRQQTRVDEGDHL